jgi:hypothetical protein
MFIKNQLMSADQTNKEPFGNSNRRHRDDDKRRMGKPGNSLENDPSSGQPPQECDEEKRIDYSQQIGEFSNWSRRS